ncbi:GIY-YIG nuclease family protein [Candidatus Gottesmanbacteria bacterium]|nr:GIY-YIG nuclease family protein [Candidatus Gottesmanbacteria bacterium]MBI5452202.1 GIY-YIG nuclease family protein [Candidatus Gottesmanbacteria bacterium]
MMKWYIYIVKCSDGYLYTGITQNLQRRLTEHNSDDRLGSKFIRVRRPVELAYKEIVNDKSTALKRELEIKGWSRKKKLDLISGAVLCP